MLRQVARDHSGSGGVRSSKPLGGKVADVLIIVQKGAGRNRPPPLFPPPPFPASLLHPFFDGRLDSLRQAQFLPHRRPRAPIEQVLVDLPQ
jgi:hypothetical protein